MLFSEASALSTRDPRTHTPTPLGREILVGHGEDRALSGSSALVLDRRIDGTVQASRAISGKVIGSRSISGSPSLLADRGKVTE
jgi:hypothetical protein